MLQHFVFCVSALFLRVGGFDTERDLRTHLLQGYDRNSHPLDGTGSPTEVRLQVHIADLWSFNEKSMTFEADLFIRERWSDPRLSFSNLQGGARFARVDLVRSTNSVWRSVLYFPDVIKESVSEELLHLYPDGSMWRSTRIIVKLKCTMDFHAFPFDSQQCPIRLEMWRQTTSEAILASDPPSGIENVKANQWSAFSSTQSAGIVEYSTGNYSYSEVSIDMTREMLGWQKSAIVPVFIFVLMSYSGFWISPAAVPARITLAIVTVLITLTLWNNILSKMPLVTYPVWLRDYIMGAVFFNLCTVFSYTAVNYGMQCCDAHKGQLGEAKAKHAAALEAEHKEKTLGLMHEQLRTTGQALSSTMLAAKDDFWSPSVPDEDNFRVPRERGYSTYRPKWILDEFALAAAIDGVGGGDDQLAEKKVEEVEPAFGKTSSLVTEAGVAAIALELGASKFVMLVRIDWHMRWLFPAMFGVYNIFMLVVWADSYKFDN